MFKQLFGGVQEAGERLQGGGTDSARDVRSTTASEAAIGTPTVPGRAVRCVANSLPAGGDEIGICSLIE